MYIHLMVSSRVEEQFNGFKAHIKSSLSGENWKVFIDLTSVYVQCGGGCGETSVDTTDQVNLPV